MIDLLVDTCRLANQQHTPQRRDAARPTDFVPAFRRDRRGDRLDQVIQSETERSGAGSAVGGLQSVNGSIKIAENVSVDGDVGTVNGSIRLAGSVTVEGEVETVNGSVGCDAGGKISHDITTVNGSIRLTQTEVGGNLGTVNGSLTLEEQSRVSGNIFIKGKSTRYGKKKAIEIDISGGSVVEGDIIVRDRKRDVKVILSGGGKVLGEIEGAELVEAE